MSSVRIRSVGAYNFLFEMSLIQSLLVKYPLISIDTEFPGTIYRSSTPYSQQTLQERYHHMKVNVDCTMLIQLGMCLSNLNGELPTDGLGNKYVWQFNFREFDLNTHVHVPESIQLLKNNGTDFEENRRSGIDAGVFAKAMFSMNGLLHNSYIHWITFQGAYDFGYLIKILTGAPLPNTIEEFFILVPVFFGYRVFDLKHVAKHCLSLPGGLEKVAEALQVTRVVGKHHQAGSDCLLTMQSFQNAIRIIFRNEGGYMLLSKNAGVLFGLETTVQ